MLIQAPQQSPPSKLHSALFVSSLHTPLPRSAPLEQSLEIEIFEFAKPTN